MPLPGQPPSPAFLPPPHLQPLATTNLLSITVVLPFLEFHLNAIIWYVIFWIWLLSLSIMPLRFIHVVTCITSSLLSIAESYSIAWMYHRLFIHSPAGRHLGYFQFEAIMNTMLLWTFMYKSLYVHVSIRNYAGKCLTTSSLEWREALICSLCWFLRYKYSHHGNLKLSMCYHQLRVPVAPHPCQHLIGQSFSF